MDRLSRRGFDLERGERTGRIQVLGLSIWKLAIIGGIIVLLFGKGKISGMMGDLAQGIKSFKRGMADDESQKSLDQKAETVGAPVKEKVSG
jgi:sec-independent protein translocase protein TatA